MVCVLCVWQPLLVETKKAKRFNSPLRGLHELCSWGAKEGLRKLRCIHEVSHLITVSGIVY